MDNCATCMQNSDNQKSKPGIVLCEGCQQSFCLSHFNEHRQTLNNTLDGIVVQRDALRSRIKELPKAMSKEHLKEINDWKSAMLETVIKAAKNAGEQVYQLMISEMERECSELTNKITTFQHNDNYFETDLRKLQSKTEKLNEKLNDLSDLNRIQLNLPTLDCSNMIQIKSFKTHSLSAITKSNDPDMVKPKEEYSSCIEQFLTTHQPSTNITIETHGYVCASSSMLVHVDWGTIYKFIFREGSTSTCSKECSAPLDVKWSHQFQQFIILSSKSIVVVNAVENKSVKVVPDTNEEWQHMVHWKNICLISDSKCRLFLYEMNGTSSIWFLLYCCSPPTTCASDEKITAIGINEHHIVLSIQSKNQCRFALHKHNMRYCLDVQLTQHCTAIQALPYGEWLLYDSIQKLYYVIDYKLEQHEERYLSSLKDIKCVVTCDETDKVLVVLLNKQSTTVTKSPMVTQYTMYKKPINMRPFTSVQQSDHHNVKIYYVDTAKWGEVTFKNKRFKTNHTADTIKK